MIEAVIICNTSGKLRLSKFYDETDEEQQQEFLRETYSLLRKRLSGSCNFLEVPFKSDSHRIIYRQYATIYIIFCVDVTESELGILDLIQVFVDLLDRTFENVCELDIIFNADKVHYLLNELICGGIVLETNHAEILKRVREQERLRGDVESADNGSLRKSLLSDKLFSSVRAGSSLITSAVSPSYSFSSSLSSVSPFSTRGWASVLAASATYLRTSNRSGFHYISGKEGDSEFSRPKESEKLCL